MHAGDVDGGLEGGDVDAELGLLIGDVLVSHPDLRGLDVPSELFAVDLPDLAEGSSARWGAYWRDPLEAAPELPDAVRCGLPEEGGFVMRALAERGSAAAAATAFVADGGRRVRLPPRGRHRELGYPAPILVCNEIFIEIRYALAPSLVPWFSFEDIRDGICRLFALPDFEGDVRMVSTLSESVAIEVLSQKPAQKEGRERHLRVTELLHAAANSPPVARWPTTLLSASRREDGELFPHQWATLAWMSQIEDVSANECVRVKVEPLQFAGEKFGSEYEVLLPRGGVIAHPPGAGKTRIVARFVASKPESCDTGHLLSTLVICPAHLSAQWETELKQANCEHFASVVAFAAVEWSGPPLRRIVIDEPQDCPDECWSTLLTFVDAERLRGSAIWILCGTARTHCRAIGRLLCGLQGWYKARVVSEWRGEPMMSHLIAARFLADPPWACLPMPPLEMLKSPVMLRPRESADAAIAGLAGFIIDSVLLLSYGPEAVLAAVQERDKYLAQLGWSCHVSTWQPVGQEHTLTDWEGVIEQRGQQRLEELVREIQGLESEESRQQSNYQLSDNELSSRGLGFLARDVVRLEIEGLDETPIVTTDVATAEWNFSLGHGLAAEVPVAEHGIWHGPVVALLPAPADGGFAVEARSAAAAGAICVLFASQAPEPRPFGYRHDEEVPGIPAAMIGSALALRLRTALAGSSTLTARFSLVLQADDEDVEDVDQGIVSAYVAQDGIDTELNSRLKGLRDEQRACERALRFGREVRRLLETDEANCPVCLRDGREFDALAVLPDCCHFMCRPCLDRQFGRATSVTCPLCRMSAGRADIAIFRTSRPLAPFDDAARNPCPDTAAPDMMPSKLGRLLRLLREILDSGPSERALVFTQWVAHVTFLRRLLGEHGVESLALDGDLCETMGCLTRFGQPGEPRVLILSSQRHSSGINLQAARHVIIVHPYCTPTAAGRANIFREQMLAYEAQAIGRVRRFPQRKVVRVHRLFAVGSIEEELYDDR